MDWFESLFGFHEKPYAETKSSFRHDGRTLTSRANGRSWAVGELEMAPLADLRRRVREARVGGGRPRLRIVEGDVRKLHAMPEYAGALFQVASQFNALEMVGPHPQKDVRRGEIVLLSVGGVATNARGEATHWTHGDSEGGISATASQ